MPGIFVGYVLPPGGKWSKGAMRVIPLSQFEKGKGKAKGENFCDIDTTREVQFTIFDPPVFPKK